MNLIQAMQNAFKAYMNIRSTVYNFTLQMNTN